MGKKLPVLLMLLAALISGCSRCLTPIEPRLIEPVHPKESQRGVCLPADFSMTPFKALSEAEFQSEWGKELWMGDNFAEDFDLFRAITSYKRALYLIGPTCQERRLEIEYKIALAYYLGRKYEEATYTFESTDLVTADKCFPAFHDLLLLLYDSYKHLCNARQSAYLLSLIEENYPEEACRLKLFITLEAADVPTLLSNAELAPLFQSYQAQKKSPRTAEMLNALLPGAGYLYVGQRQTALTAFLINSLFIAAAYGFFDNGYTAAGIITLSLESGWYFGGILGGGMAARQYNEHLFECYAEKAAQKERPYPLVMLRYSF